MDVNVETSSIFWKVLVIFWVLCWLSMFYSLYTTSKLVTHILQVLQTNTDQIASKQLTEELRSLHRASIHVNPRLQNVGPSDSSTSDVYTNDIESEANSYFHQIFSGQLTVDSMIQMLTRFKESSDQRFVDFLILMDIWVLYHAACV